MLSKKDQLKKLFIANPNIPNAEAAEFVGCSRRTARRIRAEMWEGARQSVKTVITNKEIVGVLSDIHVPYQDIKALETSVSYLKEAKITKLVLLGDICDFYSISYYKKDPRRMPFMEELELAQEFLKDLREMFPNIPIIYIEGNHEARLYSYLVDKAPALLGVDGLNVADALGLRELSIEYVDNVERIINGESPYRIGELIFVHGHEIKASWSSVNLPRLIFQKTKANTIFGHFHKQQSYITKNIFGRMLGAWSVGCLCHLAEKFMPVNEWSHGFAIVRFNKETGRFNVDNKLIYDGEVL